MHVLVTGGTGLIGQALGRSLVKDGHKLTILTRNPDLKTRAPTEAKLVKWDARTTDGWGELMEEVDAVVHLAGESLAAGRWTSTRKQRIRDSRVLSGQALAAAIEAADHRPGVLVQSSAVGYYGTGSPLGPEGSRDEVIDEGVGPGTGFLAQVCLAWEAATAPVERLGVRRPIVRTGIVLSKEGGALPRVLPTFKFFVGGPMGSGNQWWPWIHIVDEVRAIRFLIENDEASGPFNLTGPSPVTNKEFASTIGSAMGRPSRLSVPGLILSTFLGEMATVLLDGQRAVPGRLRELGFVFEYPTLKVALGDLL